MDDQAPDPELAKLIAACEAHGIETVWEGIDKSLTTCRAKPLKRWQRPFLSQMLNR